MFSVERVNQGGSLVSCLNRLTEPPAVCWSVIMGDLSPSWKGIYWTLPEAFRTGPPNCAVHSTYFLNADWFYLSVNVRCFDLAPVLWWLNTHDTVLHFIQVMQFIWGYINVFLRVHIMTIDGTQSGQLQALLYLECISTQWKSYLKVIAKDNYRVVPYYFIFYIALNIINGSYECYRTLRRYAKSIISNMSTIKYFVA